MKNPNVFHIVVESNSQALPLPWRQKDDSIEPGKFTPYWKTYAHVFKELIAKETPNEVQVSIFASRGGTVRNAIGRIQDTLRWMGPDVTIFNHGIVECWLRKGGQKVPIAEFEQAIKDMITYKQTKNPTLLLVLLGIPHTSWKLNLMKPRQAGQINAYNDVLRNSATGNVVYLDLTEGQRQLGRNFLHPDGNHFTAAAHEWIGQELMKIATEFKLVEQRCALHSHLPQPAQSPRAPLLPLAPLTLSLLPFEVAELLAPCTWLPSALI